MERVLAERRGDVLALHLHELDGQGAGLEDECEVLGLLNGVEARDLGLSAGDSVAQARVVEVDRRERADLAVEDDREALFEGFALVAGGAGEIRLRQAALGKVPGDLVELVPARVGEAEEHDRLVPGAEVRPRLVALEVVSGQLRDGVGRVVRLVLEEVVVGRPRRGHADARADRGVVGAGEDDLALRHRVELRALGLLAAELLEQVLLRLARAAEALLVLRVQVPLGRRPGLGRLLLARQERQELRRGVDLTVGARRRRQGVSLQVEELQLGGLADDLGGAPRIVDAGELDGDLVGALARDDRLGDADLVDALPHDLDRAVEIVLRDLPTLRRLRLEDDLEPALQVEAQGRRAEERQHDDPGHGGQDRGENDQVATHS